MNRARGTFIRTRRRVLVERPSSLLGARARAALFRSLSWGERGFLTGKAAFLAGLRGDFALQDRLLDQRSRQDNRGYAAEREAIAFFDAAGVDLNWPPAVRPAWRPAGS